MGDNVVKVDFGREYNESAQKLARLFALVEDHKKAITKDPVQFLDVAREEIMKLREQMQALHDVLFHVELLSSQINDAPPRQATFETVTVTRADYDKMKAAEAIAASWRGSIVA